MIQRDFKIRKILLLIFLLPVMLASQIVEDIEIINNKNFSAEEYKGWIGINTGSKYFPAIKDTIENRISDNLTNLGYYNFSITNIDELLSADTSAVKIRVNIHEGYPTYITKINFIKTDSLDIPILADMFEYNIDVVFNKAELESTINTVLLHYENNGYPFASLKIESIFFEHDTLDEKHKAELFILLDKNTLSEIDEIKIIGNEKTNDNVILRNSGINKGEIYSQQKIDKIPSLLNKLRFFESVSTPKFYFNSKNVGTLELKLKEQSTNNFDGIIGYVPGDKKTDGYFTGFFNISLRNLFGTGRAIAFRWQRETSLTQELNIKYFEPWMFGYPFNIGGEFYQRKQDTTYVKRFIKGELEFIATEDMSASLLIESESIIPTLNENNIFTVYNSSILTTGVQFLYDTRDDFYSPTKGLMFLNTYKYSTKNINGPSKFIPDGFDTKISMQKFELDFHFLLEVFNHQITSLKVHARELRSDFIEISDLYQFGGTNTLRGYRENQFTGKRLIWSNIEYRYLLSKKSFVFAFYDIGYYLRNENSGTKKISATKSGFGFGLNIETAMGVMNISYALGDGDTFSTGKIHFGLINEF
ncbi:MAG: BamA/TamA family outer membrane protein [Melioribacteraceae bacterium]|nr:BamA/TamA family outer membrane protein [Melioribacteraceae bacterium]